MIKHTLKYIISAVIAITIIIFVVLAIRIYKDSKLPGPLIICNPSCHPVE